MSDWEEHQEKTFSNENTYSKLEKEEWDRVNWIFDFIKEGDKVLELGCNNGTLAKKIYEKTKDYVYAMDFPRVIAKLKPEDKIVFWGGSLEEPFPISTVKNFDVIICLEVIEHIINLPQLLKEILRVLKPGGKFLFSTPNAARPGNVIQMLQGNTVDGLFNHEEKPMHIRFYTHWTLGDTLNKAGFKYIVMGGALFKELIIPEEIISRQDIEEIMALIRKHRKFKITEASIITGVAEKEGSPKVTA